MMSSNVIFYNIFFSKYNFLFFKQGDEYDDEEDLELEDNFLLQCVLESDIEESRPSLPILDESYFDEIFMDTDNDVSLFRKEKKKYIRILRRKLAIFFILI